MKKCMTAINPHIGFNNFMSAVFDHPNNQIVQKKNPNISYSKVHVGDGQWEFQDDNVVLPTVTHHMTTAAIAKSSEFQESLRFVCENFLEHVKLINENDEVDQYKQTLKNLKYILVNMTKKIEDSKKLSG